MLPGDPPKGTGFEDMLIEVMIDAEGHPDMQTLRITGKTTIPGRESLTQWVRESKYTPARQDGQPVAAMFRTRKTGLLTIQVSR